MTTQTHESRLLAQLTDLQARLAELDDQAAAALLDGVETDDFGLGDERDVIERRIASIERALPAARQRDQEVAQAAAAAKAAEDIAALDEALQRSAAAVASIVKTLGDAEHKVEKALLVLDGEQAVVRKLFRGLPAGEARDRAMRHADLPGWLRSLKMPSAPDEAINLSKRHELDLFRLSAELIDAGLLPESAARPVPQLVIEAEQRSAQARQEAEAARAAEANLPTVYGGSFLQQPDGYWLRDGDSRIFERTDRGMIEVTDHPGYSNRRRAPIISAAITG